MKVFLILFILMTGREDPLILVNPQPDIATCVSKLERFVSAKPADLKIAGATAFGATCRIEMGQST